MKSIICFIDDSRFEHDLVRKEISPCAADLEFIRAYTFEEAKAALVDRMPALFLLDLWGQDDDVIEPLLTGKEELEKKIARFPTLDDIYAGLDDFKGDVNNEYLKRLFVVVDRWRTLFEEVCGRIGQNREYGLSNLEQARRHYPQIPAVFYTRKSLINDAVAMIRAGVDGLFIKPTGANDSDTHRLTREYAPGLIDELRKIMKPGRLRKHTYQGQKD